MEKHTLAEAADWFVKMHDGSIDAATRAAFSDWLLLSPDNVQAFLQIARTVGDIGLSTLDLNIDELIRSAALDDERSNVIVFDRAVRDTSSKPPLHSNRSKLVYVGATVSLLVIVIIAWVALRAVVYRTEIGEQRSLAFDDGTFVMINTSSELSIARGRPRHVKLKRGEAQFRVGSASVPFVVDTIKGSVIATDAKFNVRVDPGRVSVGVLTGRVEVRGSTHSLPLRGGQTAAATGVSEFVANTGPPLLYARGWPEHLLAFENRRLDEVVAELNRYHAARLRIADSRIEGRLVTGKFDIHDIKSFILYLSQSAVASVRKGRDGDWELRAPLEE